MVHVLNQFVKAKGVLRIVKEETLPPATNNPGPAETVVVSAQTVTRMPNLIYKSVLSLPRNYQPRYDDNGDEIPFQGKFHLFPFINLESKHASEWGKLEIN
jgi:hypothetical protein